MAEKQVKAADLRGNQFVQVRGKVVYSHIASMITEDEAKVLAKSSPSRYPTLVEHTRFVIDNAQVMQSGNADFQQAEVYVAERMYMDKHSNTPAFAIDNKSRTLPPVAELDTTTNTYNQVLPLRGELARGLDVTICLRTISPSKPGQNSGVVIDRILINEPIKYYGSAGFTNDIYAQMGITFGAEMKPQTSLVDSNPEGNVEDADNTHQSSQQPQMPGRINTQTQQSFTPQPQQQSQQPFQYGGAPQQQNQQPLFPPQPQFDQPQQQNQPQSQQPFQYGGTPQPQQAQQAQQAAPQVTQSPAANTSAFGGNEGQQPQPQQQPQQQPSQPTTALDPWGNVIQ